MCWHFAEMYEAGCDAETISGLTKISIETVKSVLKDVW